MEVSTEARFFIELLVGLAPAAAFASWMFRHIKATRTPRQRRRILCQILLSMVIAPIAAIGLYCVYSFYAFLFILPGYTWSSVTDLICDFLFGKSMAHDHYQLFKVFFFNSIFVGLLVCFISLARSNDSHLRVDRAPNRKLSPTYQKFLARRRNRLGRFSVSKPEGKSRRFS